MDNRAKKNRPELIEAMRHSCEHVLEQAMSKLYPDIKMAIGPAITDGYYFDFDLDQKISENDFERIEAEMNKIVKADLPFVKQELELDKARQLFANNPYKQELLDELSNKNQKVTVYWTGKPGTGFVDLCKGPHVASSGKIGPFKLLNVAGAYWRGNEKNKMLTRIYGTCFSTQKELDKYLWQKQEAKKRDHRKLGKKLDLFVINDSIGKGLPLLTPKGTLIRTQIINYERQLEKEAGFMPVVCPHIARTEIYKKTGHWQHYKEVMYAPFGIDGDEYVLKPMNCPHHYMIYASRPRSYRDLPFRLSEAGTCYRYEKSGELSGLLRVRALTIDDAHILMTEDQIEQEFKLCIDMVLKMFKAFGLNKFWVRLSMADPTDAVKYIADEKTWQKAGDRLKKICINNKLEYKIVKGEASFYGPKLDFMVEDSLGREWQMSTLQLDLFMSKRLKLVYTDKDGKEKNPVILHRGLTGSLERTLGILIEHFAGAFPIWLAPTQVVILPISDKHIQESKNLLDYMTSVGLRLELWLDETISRRIRKAEVLKIPYMIVVGDKEVKTMKTGLQKAKVSVRCRDMGDLGQITVSNFIKKVQQEVEKKE